MEIVLSLADGLRAFENLVQHILLGLFIVAGYDLYTKGLVYEFALCDDEVLAQLFLEPLSLACIKTLWKLLCPDVVDDAVNGGLCTVVLLK